MTLTDAQQQDIDCVLAGVAIRLSRKHRPYAEAPDVLQDLWVWCLARPKRIQPVLDAVEPDDYKRELRYLSRNAYRAGDIKCREDKAKRTGYKASDEYFYTQTLIVALIEAHCNEGSFTTEQSSERVRRTRTLSEGMEVETMLADFRSAFESLDPDQQSLLVRLYGEQIPVKDIAAERDVTRQAIEARASRLLDKLIDALGGPSPYR